MPTPAPAFAGFATPNYTMVPDQLFDELLPQLSGSELKVLLYIIRRTFGFKKESDAISLNQMLNGISTKDGHVLDRGVGLSKPTLLEALRSLIERHIIHAKRQRSAERGDEATVYRLHLATDPQQTQLEDGGEEDKKVYQGGGKETLPGGRSKNFTTQETVKQKTDYSNIRKEKEFDYAETTLVVEERVEPDVQEKVMQSSPKPYQSRSSTGFSAVSTTIEKRREQLGERGSATRDAILLRIEQFAAEFGDKATLKSSTSRAYNLLRKSGLPGEQFMHCLWEARAITRERSGQVKSKMSYFFSVLEERLGVGDRSVEVLK